jgi:hypothetical protein
MGRRKMKVRHLTWPRLLPRKSGRMIRKRLFARLGALAAGTLLAATAAA